MNKRVQLGVSLFFLLAVFLSLYIIRPGVTSFVIFQTNDQSTFDQGTYTNAEYDPSGFVQLSSGQSTGTYTSKVFDAGEATTWNNIAWIQGVPCGLDLPDNQQVESASGGADMTGNALLLHMDEVSGAIVDNSGNGDNGAASEELVYSAAGRFNTALSFDEDNDDYITFGQNNGFGYNNSFSIVFWMKASDQGLATLFSKGDNNDGYFLDLESNGQLEINLHASNSDKKIRGKTSTKVDDNSWQCVAITYSGSRTLAGLHLYIDGADQEWASSTDNLREKDILTTSDYFTIGKRASGGEKYYTGLLDEFAVFSRELSPTEILNQYKRGILQLNLSARSCDDESCDGEEWGTDASTTPHNVDVQANRYFQYKAVFETENLVYSPTLHSVVIDYEAPDETPPSIGEITITSGLSSGGTATVRALIADGESGVNSAWTTINKSGELTNYTLVQEGETNYYSGSFLAGGTGVYYYKVIAEDAFGNAGTASWQVFTVSKPSAAAQTEVYPTHGLPSSSIVISADIIATDELREITATLNTPDGFIFPFEDYSQSQIIGDIPDSSTEAIQWFLYLPSNTGAYNFNVNLEDYYGNLWYGSSRQIIVTYDPANLTGRVEALEVLVTTLQSEVSSVETGFGALESDFSTISSSVDSLSTSVEANSETIASFSSSISSLQEQTSTVQNELLELSESVTGIDTLVSDVTTLTSRTDSINSSLTSLDESMSSNTLGITSINSQITSIDSEVTLLQSDVVRLNTNVVSLSQAVDDHNTLLSSFETDIDSASSSITSLSSTAQGLQTQINANTVTLGSLNTSMDSMQSDIDVFGEQVIDLISDVDLLNESGLSNDQNISSLNLDVASLTSSFVSLESIISIIQAQIDINDYNLSDLNDNLTSLLSDITVLTTKTSQINITIATHASSISTLQNSLATVESEVNTIEATISSIQNDISLNQLDILAVYSSIETVLEDVGELETQLGSVSSTVSQNSGNITSLQGNVTQMNLLITGMETNITGLNSNIVELYNSINVNNLNITGLGVRVDSSELGLIELNTSILSLNTLVQNLEATTTQLASVVYLNIISYPETEAGNDYHAEFTVKNVYGDYVDLDELPKVTLVNPAGWNFISATTDGVEKTGTGTYSYTVTTNSSWPAGFWQIIANATKNSVSQTEKAYFKFTSGPFDVRDISVLDSTVPGLQLSVILENLGGDTKDMIVNWQLARIDTNVLLDFGRDTIGVAGESEKDYVISPSTSYVGPVKVTFMGYYGIGFAERAGALHTFSTTSVVPVAVSETVGSGAGGGGSAAGPSTATPTETVEETVTVPEAQSEPAKEEIETVEVYYPAEEEVVYGEDMETEFVITNTGEDDMNNVKLALEGVPTAAVSIFPAKYESIRPGETQKFKVRFNTNMLDTGTYTNLKYKASTDTGIIERNAVLVIKEKLTGKALLIPKIQDNISWIVSVIMISICVVALMVPHFHKKIKKGKGKKS